MGIKRALVVFFFLLSPLPVFAQSEDLHKFSMANTTLSEVREATLVKAQELRDLMVVYEASPEELAKLDVDLRWLRDRESLYYKSDMEVVDVNHWRLKGAMRLMNTLNFMRDGVVEAFKKSRSKYCYRSFQIEEREGYEAGIEAYTPKQETPAEKAEIFCVVATPSPVPRI